MATYIKLHHLGEEVLCAMLKALRSELHALKCASCARLSVAQSFQQSGVQDPIFRSEASGLRVLDATGKAWPLDGMHRIDVLAATGSRGVAFEVKLGFDRLSLRELRERFQVTCSLSGHKAPRLNGSMIAVLDRCFPTTQHPAFEGSRLTCGSDEAVELADLWWLVVRKRVWRNWGNELQPQLRSGHILLFEDLVDQLGGRAQFDLLVTDLVGSGWYDAWHLDD